MNAARWSPAAKRAALGVVGLALLFVVWRAGDIVRPFIWGAILAYVLLPLVSLLQRRAGVPRSVAAAAVFALLLAAIVGGGRVLIPLAVGQVLDLQQRLPSLLANLEASLSGTLDQFGLGPFREVASQGTDLPAMLARAALPIAVGLGHALLEFLVFLIATFFLLRDAPRLFDWFRRVLPPGQRAELVPLAKQVNELLGLYVRGQIILIGIMATVTTVGLTLFGVPFSFVLGMATGVLEIIPIVGPIMAGAIACLVALGNPNPFGWSQPVYVGAIAVMYTVLRHAEDYFVIPLVIGRIVRLHPALVIFSLLAGGALFGLLGVILAVPLAATLRLVLIYVGAKLRDEDPFSRLEAELEPVPPHDATPALQPAASGPQRATD
ncbi:MAG: AI-2E family transporter [Chloroflexota bacterium]|nr:AI-2E family transporter [Chloroflexota bacterium]